MPLKICWLIHFLNFKSFLHYRGGTRDFKGRVPSSKQTWQQTNFSLKMRKILDFLQKLGLFAPKVLPTTGAWRPLLDFAGAQAPVAPALLPP